MKAFSLGQKFILTTALIFGAGLSAMASTVNLQFTWTGSLWESGFTGNYIQSDDAIGIYAFNSSGNNSVPNPLYSVCLSPAGLLDGGQHTYTIESFSAASPGIFPSDWAVVGGQPVGINNAAYLWNKYGSAIVNNTGSAYTGTQSQAAAALEFAIWTSLYTSTGYGALGGNNGNWTQPTLNDTTTLNYYNSFLNGLTSSGITGPQFTGNILVGTEINGDPNSGESQEFFALGTPVPEPTTMVAGALLLLPFGVSTLRMLRKSGRT